MVGTRAPIILAVHSVLCLKVALSILEIVSDVFTPLNTCTAVFQLIHYLDHYVKSFSSGCSDIVKSLEGLSLGGFSDFQNSVQR